MPETDHSKTIVLFDGYCNFCTRWVLFLIRIDKHDRFRFSASSSPAVEGLIEKYNLWEIRNESVIVIHNEQVFIKSDAILIILHTLNGFWALLDFWTVFPQRWNDGIYSFITSRRFKWFGRRNSCYLPDESTRNKFIM